MTIRALSLSLALAVLGVSTSASADEEAVDRPGGIVNGILGFGAHTGSGFALGVEGGYTLPFDVPAGHIFVGGNFTYFTGSSGYSLALFEVHGGYDLNVIKAAPVLIRPYIGLGYADVIGPSNNNPLCSALNDCGSFGGGSFVVSPGVLGAYFFTPHWFAGVDLRVDIATASYGYAAFDFFGTGGYKF
jgi:hypothetical protein